MSDKNRDLTPEELRVVRLAQDMLNLHGNEMDCESCGEQLDCLVELVAAGHDARKLIPAAQAHLECCAECREEFEALLCILRGQAAGEC